MKKILFFIGFSSYLVSCGEFGICDERKVLFLNEINGWVIEKSNDKIIGGRPYEEFVVKTKDDSLFNMSWIAYKDYYKYTNVGDSVFKKDSSLIFNIFRNDSLITVIDFGFGCGYEK